MAINLLPGDLQDQAKYEFYNAISEVFIDAADAIFPYSAMLDPFIATLDEYLKLTDKDFWARLEHLPEPALVESVPNFLNVEFEALFDIPVRVGGSEADVIEAYELQAAVLNQPNNIQITQNIEEEVPVSGTVTSQPVSVPAHVTIISPAAPPPPGGRRRGSTR